MNLKGNLTSKGLQGCIGKSRMQGILGTNPAAIPITVDNALSLSSTNPVQNKVITAAITNRLWSDEVKAALLQIVEKVAYIDEHGQDYYDALYDALYPPVGLDSISAVFDAGGATIYNTDTLDDLKQYLTVTAYYTDGTSETVTTYTLSGSMDAGTQTITVSYGGKTTTFTVTVVALEVDSIDAVFTQSGTIYTNDTLNTLKQYLTVTATYSDSTTAVVTDYTLSGTLGEGTRTITVSYGGKTDTFTVACSVKGFLYHFEQSLASAGTKDFGFSGTENYGTGHDGIGYSYCHLYEGEDKGGIKSLSLVDTPNLSGDFTISGWGSVGSSQAVNVYILNSVKYKTSDSSSYVTNAISSVDNLASGWTFDAGGNLSQRYAGLRFQTISGQICIDLFASDKSSRAGVRLTPPSSFVTSGEWHHFALTRKSGTVRLFVDGALICSFTFNKPLAFAEQVTTAGAFKATNDANTELIAFGVSYYVDDLYVADHCKWDAAFDPAAITY